MLLTKRPPRVAKNVEPLVAMSDDIRMSAQIKSKLMSRYCY